MSNTVRDTINEKIKKKRSEQRNLERKISMTQMGLEKVEAEIKELDEALEKL